MVQNYENKVGTCFYQVIYIELIYSDTYIYKVAIYNYQDRAIITCKAHWSQFSSKVAIFHLTENNYTPRSD
jgi:hypothetical protein